VTLEKHAERTIAFSPPDYTEAEVEAVAEVIRSGWITTGPKTKLFEQKLAEQAGAQGVACLNSATSALECGLRALGIGPGDEVITSAYTYTASASVIVHVGATPVLCDTALDSYEMDYAQLAELITDKTKAVIPIDIAGLMCDYDKLRAILESKRELWKPANDIQKHFDRVIILADAAHSFGASYKGHASGAVADFTSFSFHAVKNVTTAEGGALAWKDNGFDSGEFYQNIMNLSLHGQTKDALSKTKAGSWEYDIAFPGWKCNMTDIQAALGLVQLERYPGMLERRKEIVKRYEKALDSIGVDVELIQHKPDEGVSSCHLMLVRLTGHGSDFRNRVIQLMAEQGVSTNVHYKPLPMLTAYKDLGFNIADFPNAYAQYKNEITLPLHTLLTDEDVDYIAEALKSAYAETARNHVSVCVPAESRGFI
jgi:dTDP-4-amino-4,6-dideoxygalactose transaminase